ncbi:nitroreductase family protein [Streptomyces sp. NPDC048420]|uniref:Acg family FMN-binding oxidoreductase n=1 Tax=Streptomyces sp. NPDC048420 TaxID=3155755 RepID=UPI0034199E5E
MPPTRTAVLDAATLETLVSAAVAAPSIHNTQPWRFRLDPDQLTLEIRAATQRGLRRIDPTGQALHLSVGCAVLNLRIAVEHFGWEPVTRLLPRADEPDLLATVRLGGTARTAPYSPLYDAVWRRHSSRFPFTGRPLPAPVLAELADAAHVEGARLQHFGAPRTERVLRLTREAEQRNTIDQDRVAESRRWVTESGDTGLGIPPEALGPHDVLDRVPMRDFGSHAQARALTARAFEEQPSIALLSSVHDRRSDWLRAGQALERVLLVATVHGVRASLLHQAMEWPDLRERLTPPTDARPCHAQIAIRLGYGPEGPVSPRTIGGGTSS